MNYYGKTRLKRRFEKQAKREIFLSLLGILILLFILFKFGFSAASTIVKVFININEKSYSKQLSNNSNKTIIPPYLNPPDFATNSAITIISGKSEDHEGQIELFLNDIHKADTSIDKSGNFIFDNVELNEGINAIKVRLKTTSDQTSDFSKEYNVAFIKKSPDLDVFSPKNNSVFSKNDQNISVTGKTGPDNRVTINGYWATMQQDGGFSYILKLNDGDNTIKIEAQDMAGNTTTKEIKVKYQP